MSAVDLFQAARERLAEVAREGLGELVQPRRLLGIPRAPRIVPRGSAWHVGVLLVGEEDVFAVGDILRAHAEVRRGFTAESQRQRAALAAAAFRGGFDEGATVHIGWQRLDPTAVDGGAASGPLALVGGVPSVRWSASGGFAPLAGYLEERISLVRTPPPGA
ncbi:glutaminase [Microbacterium sp. SLBN-146]|uniref:glutaminase n=1 Tax=Microbacterium sp. SLBN-146 TaxID=2768457 RepID=UPI0011501473|nr:glutaminase [Microbacterium sp. SLBN-146]TQJ29828.1 hypothetical protein FBY39_0271 [Microbacterium sp. SLBN-146]